MSSQHVVQDLAALLSGDLDEASGRAVRAHLESCEACRGEFESMSALWDTLSRLPEEMPGPALRARFYTMLASAETGPRRGASPKEPWFARLFPKRPALQLAFGLAAVALGLIAGYRLKSDHADGTELAQLHDEVRGISRLLIISLLQQESASERLRGVSWSYRTERPDAEVTAALLETLRYDPNMNVRLAALDALSRNPDQSGLRQDLIGSLPKQSSPLVQAAIIDLMVQFHETRSLDVLKEMDRDPKLDPSVKKKIEQGIQQLIKA